MNERRRLRLLFGDGRIALMTGLAFLFCCVVLRELVLSFGSGAASDLFGEGMLIIGWVAYDVHWRGFFTSGCRCAGGAKRSRSFRQCR